MEEQKVTDNIKEGVVISYTKLREIFDRCENDRKTRKPIDTCKKMLGAAGIKLE